MKVQPENSIICELTCAVAKSLIVQTYMDIHTEITLETFLCVVEI